MANVWFASLFLSMPALYILKTGSTFESIQQSQGDFEDWFQQFMQPKALSIRVIDVTMNQSLPEYADCAGVVITGSPAMVTDKLPWSVALEQWLPGLVEQRIPVLGVCYGHQLMAESLGGEAGNHPQGKEIGTVCIQLTEAAKNDALLQLLPATFPAHVTHTQSALQLPPQAVHLASNDYEPNHAFRVGDCAWGLQFHPEFDATVMRAYISEQMDTLREGGRDPEALLDAVQDTPHSATLLARFVEIVEQFCAA